MEIVFVRHGETGWNAQRRFQGHSDVPLSERGREQARAVAAALRDVVFSHVFASDLARALETARTIVAGRELVVTTDPRLREFDLGEWEGLNWEQIVQRWPQFEHRVFTQVREYEPPGGERFAGVVERVHPFIDELRATAGVERALVVTHAGVLHAIMDAVAPAGYDPRTTLFSTAGITRLTMDDAGSRIISLNDVDHLDPAS